MPSARSNPCCRCTPEVDVGLPANEIGTVELRSCAIAPLLLAASGRLGRQRQFLRPLKSTAAAALTAGLSRAEACIAALAHPQAALLVPDPMLPQTAALQAEPGETTLLGLCTLGYDQQKAFAWLGRDYMEHHLQTLLARETLFALGREVTAWAASHFPGQRLRRLALTGAADGDLWDVDRVRGLLALFGSDALGVTLTEGGCFSPLHALLTVIAVRPSGQRPAR